MPFPASKLASRRHCAQQGAFSHSETAHPEGIVPSRAPSTARWCLQRLGWLRVLETQICRALRVMSCLFGKIITLQLLFNFSTSDQHRILIEKGKVQRLRARSGASRWAMPGGAAVDLATCVWQHAGPAAAAVDIATCVGNTQARQRRSRPAHSPPEGIVPSSITFGKSYAARSVSLLVPEGRALSLGLSHGCREPVDWPASRRFEFWGS